MAKIKVQNTEVTVITYNDKDYISLTDMVRNMENGPALIEKWLRNKNTVEFLGIWEEMYNPDFNSPEFEGIKNEAGLNRFILSVKQWVEQTNAKGIIAKAGRYGGTYAHKDIAFEFATWVSPQFKMCIRDSFRNVPAEQKKEVGMKLNELKNKAQERIASLKEAFETQDNSAAEMDLTRTAYPIELGTRHPLSIVKNEIIDIFHRLGFSIADGPEIEDDLHVFTAMNFAEDHPARDMQDTFFIEANQEDVKKNIVLRTHTSSVQARAMEHSQPPIRIICPGRVYRNEAISYRAHAFFHQVEALYIDKNVSFTDLKQVLLLFAKEMFGEDTQIRLRPSYFPFTEPSAEMDISCNICGGKGCPFCKGTGWVEILGCGMVDPNVLEANGIDSKVYSGYALGMGIERITNLKYRVNDLRLFSENDTRFLKEFEAAN